MPNLHMRLPFRSVKSFAETFLKRKTPLYVLINNAGELSAFSAVEALATIISRPNLIITCLLSV